jgi:DNA-binding transcriptional regulator YiaG
MKPKEIIKLRDLLGMTQEQLADKIGAERSTVARWETGKHEPRGGYLKSLKELQAMAKKKRK